MRSHALAPARSAPPSETLRSASPAALVFLRGRDADARLRALAATRRASRPVLGALAMELVARRCGPLARAP